MYKIRILFQFCFRSCWQMSSLFFLYMYFYVFRVKMSMNENKYLNCFVQKMNIEFQLRIHICMTFLALHNETEIILIKINII